MRVLFKMATATIMAMMATLAFASHHFESDVPELDTGDLYVFESTSAKATVFILTFRPGLSPKDSNPFIEGAHYNFHIANETKTFNDGLTFSVAYDKKSGVHLYQMDGANEKVGKIGEEIASGPVGEIITSKNGIKMWTGVITDPFPGNSAGFRRFLDGIAKGSYDANVFAPAADLFGTFYDGSIVIEVPNAMLNKQIAVYATTEIVENNQWRQVQREAHVLTTHMFLGDNNPESAEHNHHRPEIDVSQRYAMSANILRAVVLGDTQQNPVAYADATAAELLPDVLHYKVGSKAEYTVAKRNGRPLGDDAMNVALSMFAGEPIDDLVNPVVKKTTDQFPYVVKASDYVAILKQ